MTSYRELPNTLGGNSHLQRQPLKGRGKEPDLNSALRKYSDSAFNFS